MVSILAFDHSAPLRLPFYLSTVTLTNSLAGFENILLINTLSPCKNQSLYVSLYNIWAKGLNSERIFVVVCIKPTEPKISPDTFSKAFPFHLLFDRNLVIRQAGTAIARVIPETTQGCRLTEIVDMVSFFNHCHFNHYHQPFWQT